MPLQHLVCPKYASHMVSHSLSTRWSFNLLSLFPCLSLTLILSVCLPLSLTHTHSLSPSLSHTHTHTHSHHTHTHRNRPRAQSIKPRFSREAAPELKNTHKPQARRGEDYPDQTAGNPGSGGYETGWSGFTETLRCTVKSVQTVAAAPVICG